MKTMYDTSSLVLVNEKEGLQRVQGDNKLYERLLKMFIENSYLEDLESALKQKNKDKLHTEVHKIKGVAANLSLEKLYECSLHYESLLLSDKATVEDGRHYINVLKKTMAHIKHYTLK